ncbi:acyl-CoA dehydrogenase/oxidase C-terminal [Leptodontidium sp. MPI-SDFR-AT-0119]|nr:acyl-CoA dehydrogenase/oxidase C-terminal [Leptodontidium sp. MPI-SDFR-AT-0119]
MDSELISFLQMWATNCAGWDDRGADLQCVTCRLDSAHNLAGSTDEAKSKIMVLIVTRADIEGNPKTAYEVLDHPGTIGHVAVSGPHIRFSNLRVPAKNVLAPPGHGAEIIEVAFIASAALVGAMSVGLMRRCFESALDFAKRDHRNGTAPIITLQSVVDLLLNIKIRCEASRALTWKACSALEANPAAAELACETKIFCSENAVQSVVEAMNAVGVVSYGDSQPFGIMMNDALCLPLFDGGNVGVRRRQIEALFSTEDYDPWASTFGKTSRTVFRGLEYDNRAGSSNA